MADLTGRISTDGFLLAVSQLSYSATHGRLFSRVSISSRKDQERPRHFSTHWHRGPTLVEAQERLSALLHDVPASRPNENENSVDQPTRFLGQTGEVLKLLQVDRQF